ncbi:gp69 [Mycobacterium phage Barnyard]|uniref:Uncharacterized protein n=1 Tax=Mycobacterium phage Barnyard TaxID=205880 RepID=Q856A3_9CAUD|nr:gp69 [Mycobacterium phage Barnyard]AAN02123.1 hypothetical protein PBI_BARNYARD_69 [Mycobacterium phage Barnyard]
MESREEPTDVEVKRVENVPDSFCDRVQQGEEFSCIRLWQGQLHRYCDGCIEYAKQKVIEKYQQKQ